MKRGVKRKNQTTLETQCDNDLTLIPHEIWQTVFSHIPLPQLLIASQTNKLFHHLIQDIYRQEIQNLFPYLNDHADFENAPIALFIRECKRYREKCPNMPLSVILSVLNGETEWFYKMDGFIDTSLYSLRASKGFSLEGFGLMALEQQLIYKEALDLTIQCGNFPIFKDLITNSFVDSWIKNSILKKLCKNGMLKWVKAFISSNKISDDKNIQDNLLKTCITNNQIEVLKVLITCPGFSISDAFELASAEDNLEAMKLLLTNEVPDNRKRWALLMAALHNRSEVIKMLGNSPHMSLSVIAQAHEMLPEKNARQLEEILLKRAKMTVGFDNRNNNNLLGPESDKNTISSRLRSKK